MRIRVLLFFSIVPLLLGYFVAEMQGKPALHTSSFMSNAVQPEDQIILSDHGDISLLTHNGVTQITHGQKLIEPVSVGQDILAVEKTTNYSSLLMFDQHGTLLKTLFNGNSSKIDTMSWITDPSASPSQDAIAYVSDKDKSVTNVPDNALYVLNFSRGTSTNIAKPAPYSGGIADPTYDPVNGNILLYDYYQYDPVSLTPYATIEAYDATTGAITTLTFEKENAYQQALSPDGKKILYLGRNTNNINSVTLYIADFDPVNGISHINALLTGDIAYPTFSHTSDAIYYLQAVENEGYNLMTAIIKKSTLTQIKTVVSGNTLLGNSSYEVNKLQ